MQQLKMQQTVLAMQRGMDIESFEKYKKEVAKDANNKFEEAIRQKPDGKGKDYCIDAYEKILLD